MNDRIIYTQPNGFVVVVTPSGEIPTADVMTKDVPVTATNIRIATIAELPQDRVFRSAWDDSNPEDFIGTDLVKAKLVAHDIRRADRETKLIPLDNEERFTSTSTQRKGDIVVEKTIILAANAQVQIDIDSSIDETALRTVLVGLI